MKRSMAALVLGNATYPDGNDLANPVNDAEDIAAKLRTYGFEVVLATDCTSGEMAKKLKEFRALLKTHDVGLFFFAGHGMQIEGINYLLALDTDTETEDDAKFSSLSLDKVVDTMAKSPAKTKIIILDACRNNPWERNWHRGAGVRGLASVYAPKGTIIGFATSPGEVALDGVGRNGTYTAALLEHIDAPDHSIEMMFKRVRNTVAATTGGKQTSWEHTSLAGEFYFNMSIGKLIDEYGDVALADSLLLLDENKSSHRIIKGLKANTWHPQNEAMGKLTVERANKASTDNMFIIGRNIYQAACGNAGQAGSFIENFVARTTGWEAVKRKAVLDGMLFEIFFNPEGKRRSSIKHSRFDEVFALDRHAALKPSFDFIADALLAAGGDYYAVPGKGHDLAVTVTSKKMKGEDVYTVNGIYIDGVDVLRSEDGGWEDDDGKIYYSRTSHSRLTEKLGRQLIVPSKHLKVTYSPTESGKDADLRIPINWTVSKEV